MTGLRLQSGTEVQLGPLARDVTFLVRNLRVLLRPEGTALRRRLGLEPGMVGILSVVWLNPGISQNDLAATVALKKSAVTRLIQAMEAQGLIARRRAAGDRRAWALSLTAEGHGRMAAIRDETARLNEALLAGIDAADREAFFRVLARLVGRLTEQGGVDEADKD